MKTKLVYISGGDNFSPSEVKAALDNIRETMNLPDEVVLFGLSVDNLAEQAEVNSEFSPVPDHKVLQFPQIKRKSILNVIENPVHELPEPVKKPSISDEPLVVDEDDFDSVSEDMPSITNLLDKLPPVTEDSPSEPPLKNLAEEFGDFLEKEDVKPAQEQKKTKPFSRKPKGAFTNLLGDLFNYAGIANDDAEEFKLPDFIKRP